MLAFDCSQQLIRQNKNAENQIQSQEKKPKKQNSFEIIVLNDSNQNCKRKNTFTQRQRIRATGNIFHKGFVIDNELKNQSQNSKDRQKKKNEEQVDQNFCCFDIFSIKTLSFSLKYILNSIFCNKIYSRDEYKKTQSNLDYIESDLDIVWILSQIKFIPLLIQGLVNLSYRTKSLEQIYKDSKIKCSHIREPNKISLVLNNLKHQDAFQDCDEMQIEPINSKNDENPTTIYTENDEEKILVKRDSCQNKQVLGMYPYAHNEENDKKQLNNANQEELIIEEEDDISELKSCQGNSKKQNDDQNQDHLQFKEQSKNNSFKQENKSEKNNFYFKKVQILDIQNYVLKPKNKTMIETPFQVGANVNAQYIQDGGRQKSLNINNAKKIISGSNVSIKVIEENEEEILQTYFLQSSNIQPNLKQSTMQSISPYVNNKICRQEDKLISFGQGQEEYSEQNDNLIDDQNKQQKNNYSDIKTFYLSEEKEKDQKMIYSQDFAQNIEFQYQNNQEQKGNDNRQNNQQQQLIQLDMLEGEKQQQNQSKPLGESSIKTFNELDQQEIKNDNLEFDQDDGQFVYTPKKQILCQNLENNQKSNNDDENNQVDQIRNIKSRINLKLDTLIEQREEYSEYSYQQNQRQQSFNQLDQNPLNQKSNHNSKKQIDVIIDEEKIEVKFKELDLNKRESQQSKDCP